MHSMFDYQYTRDPNLAIPRDRRDTSHSSKVTPPLAILIQFQVWESEPEAKTFADHVASGGKGRAGPFRTRISGQASPKYHDGEQITRTVAVPYFAPDYQPYSMSPYYPQLSHPVPSFPYHQSSFLHQMPLPPSPFEYAPNLPIDGYSYPPYFLQNDRFRGVPDLPPYQWYSGFRSYPYF